MEIELTKTIKVDRPHEEVFSYISTFKNHKVIFSHTNIDSRQDTPGNVNVGTQMTNVAKVLGRTIEEHFVVTEFENNKRLRKDSLPGSSVPTWDSVLVKPNGKETIVEWTVYAKPTSYYLLFSPFLKKILGNMLGKGLVNLKKAVEQN